jgi:hypothetical protein
MPVNNINAASAHKKAATLGCGFGLALGELFSRQPAPCAPADNWAG